MGNINRICYEMISFLNARKSCLYSYEALDKMRQKALENQKK